MLESAGATLETIQTCLGLMRLRYIKVDAALHSDSVDEEAVAMTARGLIEQATYALDKPVSQRENTDADNGAAARCLLALEQGTGSMLLSERRKRAVRHLHKSDVRSLTHQHKSRRTGQTESYETRLMDALAHQMIEREVDYANQQPHEHSPIADQTGTLALQLVHKLWAVAGELNEELSAACALDLPRAEDPLPFGEDIASLCLFGQFWKLVHAPERESLETTGEQEGQPVAEMSPPVLIALMCEAAPFPYDAMERLADSVTWVVQFTLTSAMSELLVRWRVWLKSCLCDQSVPDPTCEVHSFRNALVAYRSAVEECWATLRDPHRTPKVYGIRRTLDETLAWYRIRSGIDINTTNMV
jgi:hypothetical protein